MRLFDGYMDYQDSLAALRLFSVFNPKQDVQFCGFKYNTESLGLQKLRKQYKYPHYTSDKNDFRFLVSLMIWTFDNLIGNGMCLPPSQMNSIFILSATKNLGIQSNCFMYAVVLNELCLSEGFFSRMVRCMPIDIMYQDCHCVTEVYCPTLQKWVVLDAANRAYYVGKDMIPPNLFEIRQGIIEGKALYVPMMERERSQLLFQYLTKNMIRFETDQVSRFDAENWTGERMLLHFQSANFPISDKTVLLSNNRSIQHVHTSCPSLFWADPVSNLH